MWGAAFIDTATGPMLAIAISKALSSLAGKTAQEVILTIAMCLLKRHLPC